MSKLKKSLGIKPKFTETELIAIKVLSTLYLGKVDWNDDETSPQVKETLESIKEKVKDY
jgi:hypothetical protein